LLRTLAHFWRVHLAVALSAAAATAVLTGALLVGDSVRGSLRRLVLDRLGRIEQALVADRFFREALADELAASGLAGAAPAIVLRGAAIQPDRGSRAAGVTILGIDERFGALYAPAAPLALEPSPDRPLPGVVVNAALARQLAVRSGDAVVLSLARPSDVPRETLMGETDPEDLLGRLRLTVVEVIPDRGIGRFGLVPTQQVPLNAYVGLREVQRALGRRGRANALFVPSGGGAGGTEGRPPAARVESSAALRSTLTLDDLGLTVEVGEGYVALGSREFVLRPEVDRALDEIAAAVRASLVRTQSYLANSMRHGTRLLPYSLVAALDPRPDLPWARLTLVGGVAAPTPQPGEILLNTWAARDLAARPGDTLAVRYFAVGPDEELTEEERALRVAGVVEMTGLGADRSLTPDYPGVRRARDMATWDPPFPVDLSRIRPEDEAYWDEHGATPKAFVSEATGRDLWSTRFGSTTAARFGLPPGVDAERLQARLRDELLRALPPEALGLRLRPVREEGLEAAQGATDFAALFLSFSGFIIVSAALLVGLLFRLGVERRAGEIGLLLALGHRVGRVRRRLLAEGFVLAAGGGCVGLAGGVGYAWLMMAGLRTLWRPAVGSAELYLHVAPPSLPLGWGISVVVVLAYVALAVRRLVRIPPQRLLAGSWADAGRARGARGATWLAATALATGLALLAVAVATGATSSPLLVFASGALLLVSGLSLFARWCRRPASRRSWRGAVALPAMAARNCAWSPGRSLLSVALVASACFVLVLVAASTGEEGDLEQKGSGSGGYALVAESDVPLQQDLGREADRHELGFPAAAVETLRETAVTAFRVLPGDDASCLNLYRPERPRLLGVPPGFIERGAFTFREHAELGPGEDGPWRLLQRPLGPGVVPAVADFGSATWILHLGLGDELTIDDERGEPLRLRIVGLLERSLFQSEILISEASFLEHFPGRSGDAYFLIDAPPGQAAAVSELLERELAEFGFDVSTTRDRLAGYRTVENTYIATFRMLGALGLLLGTVGLGVVLLRNVVERRAELATLRAFGFRRARLAWLVVAETALLLVCGVAIGTLAALVAVAPTLAARALPWPSLALTLAAVGAVGMLASALAVRGALHAPLLPALKAER